MILLVLAVLTAGLVYQMGFLDKYLGKTEASEELYGTPN